MLGLYWQIHPVFFASCLSSKQNMKRLSENISQADMDFTTEISKVQINIGKVELDLKESALLQLALHNL